MRPLEQTRVRRLFEAPTPGVPVGEASVACSDEACREQLVEEVGRLRREASSAAAALVAARGAADASEAARQEAEKRAETWAEECQGLEQRLETLCSGLEAADESLRSERKAAAAVRKWAEERAKVQDEERRELEQQIESLRGAVAASDKALRSARVGAEWASAERGAKRVSAEETPRAQADSEDEDLQVDMPGRVLSGDEAAETAAACRVVDETNEQLTRLMLEADAAPRKQKQTLLRRVTELEESPEFVAASRFVEDPRAEVERRRSERTYAETRANNAIASVLPGAALPAPREGARSAITGSEGESAAEVAQRRRRVDARKDARRRATAGLCGPGQQEGVGATALFEFEPAGPAEVEPFRRVAIRVDAELGAGIGARPTWFGMVVEDVEDAPGQVGLRVGDTIVEIAGVCLVGLGDSEGAFAEALADGAPIVVEPPCAIRGAVPRGLPEVEWNSLLHDIELFAGDYQVMVTIAKDRSEVELVGSRSAAEGARKAATDLMRCYFGHDFSQPGTRQ